MIGEILVVVLLVKVYDMIRSLAAVRAAPAQRHGAGILSIEQLLHLDWEAAANRWLTSHPPLSLAAAYWYEATHILVTLSVLVWCYVARPGLYRPMRNALAITNVVGMTVFYLFPVMPPRLLPGGGYTDSVADAGFGTTHSGPVPADQYAAMPSLHLAWAVWTACLAAALLAGRRGRAWCYLYPLTTAIVVVVTANHFILDVVAGTAVGLSSIAAARAVPLVSIPLVQSIRRYSNSAGTNTPGSSSTQPVTSRYPTTAVTAVAGEIPPAVRPPSRVISSEPVPPGDGTAADSDEAIR